ncbi:organic solute transporter Ostalpha-domain-containing protein [Cokeromyces recurvatus]|uniref:organic solute transporter Ostalpha-domain-containing protein n=1 Tax=Cokeromyces recurvatus TaxID=90255 RepID=UPI00221E64FC|nr:organic solute transporter Ostalpha-domain-containing protein [Cokeromyces recurvatus]KAI7905083.1 organic solute transporter Ostalpha-domain-containing protein [Cokeromyces recurvatus]
MLHSRPPSENFFPGTLYSKEIFVGDPYTFLFVKRGILQFVYVKPILAIITMVLKATGNYNEGEFSWTSTYLYITFFYNLSVCLSLWCLMVFFYATKKDLVCFRPLPKFLCVKAIIFFSFWQSVVVALLVFAGIIPEAEHISVAIQDFLVCIEMVPFAIAHSFSFSYEDYFDQTVHSARMPVRKAIQDSFGLKDVMMDTLDTLKGSRFSYRSFEPSEGVPHMGSSRTSRIMAGLRYSNITTKKRWLEPAPASKFLNSSGRGMNDEIGSDEDTEPLEFEDPDSSDEIEILYKASRTMVFGDYNYPVIDFREPLWRQARHERYKQRSYGGTSTTSNNDIKKRKNENGLLGPREGCIDVIIQQGKGNYVLVDDLSDEEFHLTSQQSINPLPKPPAAPIRKSTLTAVRYNEKNPIKHSNTSIPNSSLNPTLENQNIQPSFSTPSSSSSNNNRQALPRYPEIIKTSLSSSSLPKKMNTFIPHSLIIDNDLLNNKSTLSPVDSPSEEDAHVWKWPEENNTKTIETPYHDEDILNNNIWK